MHWRVFTFPLPGPSGRAATFPSACAGSLPVVHSIALGSAHDAAVIGALAPAAFAPALAGDGLGETAGLQSLP